MIILPARLHNLADAWGERWPSRAPERATALVVHAMCLRGRADPRVLLARAAGWSAAAVDHIVDERAGSHKIPVSSTTTAWTLRRARVLGWDSGSSSGIAGVSARRPLALQ